MVRRNNVPGALRRHPGTFRPSEHKDAVLHQFATEWMGFSNDSISDVVVSPILSSLDTNTELR